MLDCESRAGKLAGKLAPVRVGAIASMVRAHSVNTGLVPEGSLGLLFGLLVARDEVPDGTES